MLSEEGYQVSSAGSVDEALAFLERNRFDVMLCDNLIPRRPGESLVAEVRERWPRTFVVSVTGAASEQSARRLLEEGPFYHVMKPFRFDQVVRVLEVIRSEIDLRARIAPVQSVSEAVEALIRDGLEIGVLGPFSLRLPAGVHPLADVPWDRGVLATVVESFLQVSDRPSILVVLSEGWVRERGRVRIVDLIRQLRIRMEGVGPLVLGIDEGAFSQRDVLVLRESLSFPKIPFEGSGFAERQRRLILHMLASGPKRLDQLQSTLDPEEAEAGPYFLDNLVSHGLIQFGGGLYRLTHDGERAAQATAELERSPSIASGGSRIFTLQH